MALGAGVQKRGRWRRVVLLLLAEWRVLRTGRFLHNHHGSWLPVLNRAVLRPGHRDDPKRNGNVPQV